MPDVEQTFFGDFAEFCVARKPPVSPSVPGPTGGGAAQAAGRRGLLALDRTGRLCDTDP